VHAIIKNTFFFLLLTIVPYKLYGQPVPAADQTDLYIPMFKDKTIAVVGNHSSVVDKNGEQTHLVDYLVSEHIQVNKVFAPEHGFRGIADAGRHIDDGIDSKTGLPIVSLHGKNKKPQPKDLEGIDMVVFDIQDVGVRFYTYISTLQLVMEACAEEGIPIVVLDRPNPNGHYVDGPLLEEAHKSFLGMNPVPLVYGMTIGEYALMVNGEGWLDNGLEADLIVITLKNYTHQTPYTLPIKPSPNLPNATAVNLYPSLGLFEGTYVNAGRGTAKQFQQFGASFLDPNVFDHRYTPKPMPGASKPKKVNLVCYGRDLSNTQPLNAINLKWIMEAYKACADKEKFFKTQGFTKHAGTKKLQQQIQAGRSEAKIRASWKADIEVFLTIRERYLLYP
jgi:uncharacterized protein YbbC (DUF1343 family)